MKLHNLKPAAGSTHSRRRIGRGPGSGLGGTSTRGHKGAKARSGYKRKIGFEGGQMPLQRRVPKAGFKNINHKEYFAVNLATLQALAEKNSLTKIGIEELKAAGLVSGSKLVKILGNGEIKAALQVEAHAFSKTAEEAIKAVGGNTTIIQVNEKVYRNTEEHLEGGGFASADPHHHPVYSNLSFWLIRSAPGY